MMTGALNDFERFVDRLTAQLVSYSPTFEALVTAMPGVLPDEALASLRRIAGSSASRLIADAARDRADSIIDQCRQLPLPHPLDSEFRFDATTAAILATELVETTRSGDEILLIGVPTVAVELASMDVDRTIRFLGPDNCVTQAVKAASGGDRFLVEQGPGGTAAAALLDPPWYKGPMEHLINVCAGGVRDGALIKLVLPPVGTRPEIAFDRRTFMAASAAAGLELTGVEGPVCYRTPLFELAAMERQGIARLPNWRRGEAVEFVRRGSHPPIPWVRPRSAEFSVNGVRLRISSETATGEPYLSKIGDHEVFPSVSARAPGRGRAALWTTTNRAFAVDPVLLRATFQELLEGDALLHLGIYRSESEPLLNHCVDTSAQLIQQLVELLGRELDDARRLVGDGAWLMTEKEWRS